jgi:hypothetical protein
METVLSAEPTTITAGDSISWTKSFSDYPAIAWTLTYALVKSGALIEITAAADGDDYLIELAAATTADYDPGVYKYQAYITGGTSERYTVSFGTIEVLPDFASQDSGYDDRSFAKNCLDALESLIASGKTASDTYSYSIGGRQMVHYSWDELMSARDKFKMEYQNELAAESGKTQSSIVKVRFS